MKASSLLAAIVCLCLTGCAATQQTISGFVPDQFQGLPALGAWASSSRAAPGTRHRFQVQDRQTAETRTRRGAQSGAQVATLVDTGTETIPDVRYSLPPSELFKRLSQSV